MIFRLEPQHINGGQEELALIHPQDSSLLAAHMPVVKLFIAHVAAGLKGHCPLVRNSTPSTFTTFLLTECEKYSFIKLISYDSASTFTEYVI